MSPVERKSNEIATFEGASIWLSTLSLMDENFVLNKQEFFRRSVHALCVGVKSSPKKMRVQRQDHSGVCIIVSYWLVHNASSQQCTRLDLTITERGVLWCEVWASPTPPFKRARWSSKVYHPKSWSTGRHQCKWVFFKKLLKFVNNINFFVGIYFREWVKKVFFRGYLISWIGGPFANFANISGRENFWH